MLRTSRSTQRGHMIPYYSTADMPRSNFLPTDVSGLLLWLKGDGVTGTTWNDSSTNGNDLTFDSTPSVSIIDGFSGVNFDGEGNIASRAQLISTDGNYTICAIVRPSTQGNTNVAVSQDGNEIAAFQLQNNSSDGYQFYMRDSDSIYGGEYAAVSTSTGSTSSWTLITGVRDNDNNVNKFYFNGELQGSSSLASGWSSTGDFIIGRGKFNSSPGDYWNGYISDVLVYSTAISADDVAALSNYFNL